MPKMSEAKIQEEVLSQLEEAMDDDLGTKLEGVKGGIVDINTKTGEVKKSHIIEMDDEEYKKYLEFKENK